MTTLPCPRCRKSVCWEDNLWKPFCSEHCQIQDLGAWSSENYRIPEHPDQAEGESWSTPSLPGDGTLCP